MSRRPGSRLSRIDGRRAPKESFAIYCEGKVTERCYFQSLRSELRAGSIHIQWAGTPLEVVTRAEQDGLAPDASVWCVFDAEAPRLHPNFQQALDLACKNSFNCAVSNPCFELWALLHLGDQTAYVTTDEACRALELRRVGYSRRKKTLDYSALRPTLRDAIERAVKLDTFHGEGAPVAERNPSTGVWRLVEALFVSANQLP